MLLNLGCDAGVESAACRQFPCNASLQALVLSKGYQLVVSTLPSLQVQLHRRSESEVREETFQVMNVRIVNLCINSIEHGLTVPVHSFLALLAYLGRYTTP